MSAPIRLQLSRKRGFNLQALSVATNGLEAIRVDRATKWGNPFVVGDPSGCDFKDGGDPKPIIPSLTLEKSVELYRDLLRGFLSTEMHPHGHRWMDRYRKDIGGFAHPGEGVRYLKGKNLACWCAPTAPCHADVLLEVANPTPAHFNAGQIAGWSQ